MTFFLQFVIGLAGSMAIAGAAYWKGALSRSGFVAAVVLGTLLYAVSDLMWFGSLIAFFISSSLLSKVKRRRKLEAERHYEKSGARDAGQVTANGGIALIAAIGYALYPHIAWWYAYIGALAAVNADTWATELGGLSRSQPRSIISGRPVQPGTSGGVTLAGLMASLAGGCFIGASAYALYWLSGGEAAHPVISLGDMQQMWWAAGAAGILGSLLDSWLGATVQAGYRCNRCGRTVEMDEHCSMPTEHVRGLRSMRNDQVNALASLGGAGIGLLAGIWI